MKNKKLNIVEWYKDKYVLDKETLNELAQKNYDLFRRFVIILLVFSAGNLIFFTLTNLKNLVSIIHQYIYFGTFFILAIVMMHYCKVIKNCDRNKNFIWKNLPFYFTGFVTYILSLYNFFVLNTHINGILIYGIIGLIALLIYDYDPLLFFLGNIIPFIVMIPPLMSDFGLKTVGDILLYNIVIVIFSFRKRKALKRSYVLINKQKNNIRLITFGNFTMLYNGTVVNFQRKKSQELLAYLVYKKGSSVNSKELMCVLWGERADSSTYGSSLRNLIVDIKQTFKKLNIMDFFITEYNSFRINPSVVNCDYYNFLDGIKDGESVFSGEFMSQYSWAEDITAYLETLKK